MVMVGKERATLDRIFTLIKKGEKAFNEAVFKNSGNG